MKHMHYFVLLVMSLSINGIFLYWINQDLSFHHTITQAHGQIGYNWINYNNPWMLNSKLSDYLSQQCLQHNRLINLSEVNKDFGQPTQPFPVNDTIGYGLVLGLLWKITGSFNFIDVQLLQIMLFTLLLLLLYKAVALLFDDRKIAFYSCLSVLFFFPLVAYNVQAVRDIWAFYGLVFLLYGVVQFLSGQKSFLKLVACCSAFAVCQFIRPSVFLAVLTFSAVLLLYALFAKKVRTTVLTLLGTLYVTNLLFFWIPFTCYNQHAYGRNFVGPVGQDLVEGLGEFENQWNYQLSDAWIGEYIGKKYNVVYGTPEFDDAAQQEFDQAYAQNPWFYWQSIIKRIPQVIVPGLPWIFYKDSPYPDGASFMQKLKLSFTSWPLFIDFMLRQVYVRLFLLLGYLGMFIALRKKRYLAVALLFFGVICAGFGKLPSHIEYRYLIPFYWPFAILAGYVLGHKKSATKR